MSDGLEVMMTERKKGQMFEKVFKYHEQITTAEGQQ